MSLTPSRYLSANPLAPTYSLPRSESLTLLCSLPHHYRSFHLAFAPSRYLHNVARSNCIVTLLELAYAADLLCFLIFDFAKVGELNLLGS